MSYLISLFIILFIYLFILDIFLSSLNLFKLFSYFNQSYSQSVGNDLYENIVNIHLLDLVIGFQVIALYLSYLPYAQGGYDFSQIFFFVLSTLLLLNLIYIILCSANLVSEVLTETTPLILIVFFIILELLSNIFRYLSLSIRIISNVTATHNLALIILSVFYLFLNNITNYFSIIILIIFLPACVSLLCLEIFALSLQLYVISMLSSYYIIDYE